eukprot:3130851-Alexandrium_andersonii.AAC.1
MTGPSGLVGRCPELAPSPLAAGAEAELAVEALPILLGRTRGAAWVGPELAAEVPPTCTVLRPPRSGPSSHGGPVGEGPASWS